MTAELELGPEFRVSIAPMMEWTDRHCRYFLRLLSKKVWLYTEMVTAQALVLGKAQHLLQFSAQEQPVALQLGGSDPALLAQAARQGFEQGYAEINLNVGCPSDRVQAGRFGACLMAEPQLVAEAFSAMKAQVKVPVTIKTRLGIDQQDSYEFLCRFIEPLKQAGCRTFIIHARKAWLNGLSPKENREIPPLDYQRVYRLKADHPELRIELNGGIKSLQQLGEQRCLVDGVMIGRAAYENPWLLQSLDSQIFGMVDPVTCRQQVIRQLLPYIAAHLAQGGKLSHISRHILGLWHNEPGARRLRRLLSESAHKPDAGLALIEQLLEQMAESPEALEQ